ncbi:MULTISPECIES: threonine aldolase family protein [unclassified Janthinobacterium]|uniref:threonine aldolase family protein n=1 Tax=unclassified Janthinobacterium TaxID=2610881 RepID=UPI000347184A|nr:MULTISPECIES: low specificity L-threonine aldolase [unclassified Janthinobacterium]MEC5160878.1 threonine aldolase [Janthinobacterium sp. CG_S6]
MQQNHPNGRRAPNLSFTSDNTAGAAAAVMAAIADCGAGPAQPYGNDARTRRVEQRFSELFDTQTSVFLVPTGSAANALALAALTPPWGNVLCHADSHINNDECGAPEFYSGAKLVPLGGAAARIDPRQLAPAAARKVGDVHSTQPACVSISQATELGSIYSVAQVAEIGALCRANGLRLHMDGARFANALVALDCTPAQLTWQAGVDALSFGATKNGALAAEAIVLFDPLLGEQMAYRRKRGGHLLSKMSLLSAQMEAYLADDLWLHNARHANAMAARLAQGLRQLPGVTLPGPVQANIVFCAMPAALIDALQARGFSFYHSRWGAGVVRLVTSFCTSADDVDHLLETARRLLD